MTYYLDPLGLPTTQKQGVGVVKATIGINEQNQSLLNFRRRRKSISSSSFKNASGGSARCCKALQRPTPSNGRLINDDIEDAKQKLYFLDQQLNNGGLKEQYSPPGAAGCPAILHSDPAAVDQRQHRLPRAAGAPIRWSSRLSGRRRHGDP